MRYRFETQRFFPNLALKTTGYGIRTFTQHPIRYGNAVSIMSDQQHPFKTQVLPVDPSVIRGAPSRVSKENQNVQDNISPESWELNLPSDVPGSNHLLRAAHELQTSDVPVAFPTETVYGLGADATRSEAVKGIYRAKQRPSDNPLIVHICEVAQLRKLLRPWREEGQLNGDSQHESNGDGVDSIPETYKPLIAKFWPGPLTLIMPNPKDSILAPQVTAGLDTFGVRMPSNAIALALIKLANVPIAAPSANSSSKPSPTSADHVKHDLEGRISTIIDGGACHFGVESTVVNGLVDPPLILRPGGVGLNELRACPGWETVKIGYKDTHEAESRPLAPGMKYKHYSPRATVVLYEAAQIRPSVEEVSLRGQNIGVVRTKRWKPLNSNSALVKQKTEVDSSSSDCVDGATLPAVQALNFEIEGPGEKGPLSIWEIDLGSATEGIARGLFSALRELDLVGVDAILVEGIDDTHGDVAAAVMNRLRKAAEVQVAPR